MAESQSKVFIQALEPVRDRMYALALERGESPAAAEGHLQRAVRQHFRAADGGAVTGDPVGSIEGELQKLTVVAQSGAETVMPADVWARLTAAAQIEAARLGAAGSVPGAARVLNPESVLLLPDPLLAPKRQVVQEDAFEGLNLSPPSRFLVAAGIAIVLGVLLTIFIVTRHSATPKGLAATQSSAATMEATAPTTTTRGAATAP